jgi:hypothetical protein
MDDRYDHELKTIQPYYDAVARGEKTFEIRYDDRNYKVGQRLWLREYDYQAEIYPGPSVYADVTYVTDYQQDSGYVVLGIRLVDRVIWDWCDAADVWDPDQVAMFCADVHEAIEAEAS